MIATPSLPRPRPAICLACRRPIRAGRLDLHAGCGALGYVRTVAAAPTPRPILTRRPR